MTMPDPLPPSPDAPPRATPSVAATVLAALPPLAAPVIALAFLFVLGHGRGLMRMIEEAGWYAWLVLASLMLGSLVCAVLAILAARSVRVPSAMALFVVALPWLCGAAGMRLGTHLAANAVRNADVASRATMMAQGISEAINARILGAWSTASLAVAMGLSLAIAAAGQRASNRKWALAAVGVVLALPVLGAAGYAFAAHMGVDAMLPASCAFGIALSLPIAAGAAGFDAPHARAAALSAAAVPMLLVAWVATAAATTSDLTREVFGAIANADAGSRLQLLAEGLAETHVGTVVGWIGAVPLALACAVVAGWAASRAKPSAGRIAGGAALAVMALLALGADALARRGVDSDFDDASRTPWSSVAGFAPMRLASTGYADLARGEPLVLAADGLHVGTQHVASAELAGPGGAARVAALVRAQLAAAASEEHAEVPEWLRDTVAGGGGDGPSPDPAIAVAIDARTSAASLRALARGAQDGGAHSLLLLGVGSREDEAAGATISAESPAFAALVSQPSSARILFESGVRAGDADASPTLWHATVGASTSGSITPRAGNDATPIAYSDEMPEHRYGGDLGGGFEDPHVYLALADDATAAGLAAAVSWAGQDQRQPVLVLGEIPGHPEQPLGGLGLLGGGLGPGPDAEGTIGLGNLGTIGHGTSWGFETGGAPGTTVRPGTADVVGSLSREVIRRVIQRHLNEVRFCYEQQLGAHPNLAGRVVVHFVIAPTGSVQAANVAESSLGSSDAEACIAAAVQRWQFPSPDGGGIVVVTYPFVLQTTGDAAAHGPPAGDGYGS